MKYILCTMKILHQLGVNKSVKGYDYILSCIQFIHNNENNYTPVTKVLYFEIAKKHNTSNYCVERNIRNVVQGIWKN